MMVLQHDVQNNVLVNILGKHDGIASEAATQTVLEQCNVTLLGDHCGELF